MCRGKEAQHSIFDPITPIQSTQDPGFRYETLDPQTTRAEYRPGSWIRFELPPEGILYSESLHFFFNLRTDFANTFGRNWAFCNDITTLFQGFRVLYGRTMVLEDIQEVGMLHQIFTNFKEVKDTFMTTRAALTGVGLEQGVTNLTNTALDRSNYHSIGNTGSLYAGQVPRRYMMAIDMGFFKKQKPIPLKFLDKRLTIEFKLQDTMSKVGYLLLAGGTNHGTISQGFALGKPVLRYKIDYLSFELEAQIRAAMRQHQLQFQWESYYYQRFQLNLNTRNQTLEVKCFKKRIKYALAVIRCEEDSNELSMDPTYTYVSLDPRATASATIDPARKTVLRNYQWTYNHRTFPDRPVEVCGVRDVEPLVSGSITTATPLLYGVNDTYTSSGAEAFYYLQETLAPGEILQGPLSRDAPWMISDSALGGGAEPITTGASNNSSQAVGAVYRSYPCSFVIAGKFAYDDVSGQQSYAIDGTTLNTTLRLSLNFNAPAFTTLAGTFGPANPMYVDMWVCYDNVLTLDENGEHYLDS